MALSFDIEALYKKTFGTKPYVVPNVSMGEDTSSKFSINTKASGQLVSDKGSLLSEQLNGIEIWLPVRFYDASLKGGLLHLPYSVIRIQGKKTIIKTPLTERRGTVKEQYNIDDYQISITGFLIGKNKLFPEADLFALKELFELNKSVKLDNALTNVFLDKSDRVVISSLELPQAEGGRKNVRSFSLELESDSIFTLEVQE